MPLKPPDARVGDAESGAWANFVQVFRNTARPLPPSSAERPWTEPSWPEPSWAELFGPIRAGSVDEMMVVGQIGQSLDGRIATETGHSHYINGPAGIEHLHRLRSLVDAVVIGVGTAVADDPQLTVRRCEGPNPARVVLDPKGRLAGSAKIFADGVRRLAIVAEGTRSASPAGVENIALPADGGRIAPSAILAALAQRGLHRILIEGGADTVSCFLAAGCLDRLHVMVAPIILGSGRASFVLPPVERADQALRAPMRSFRLGDEVLFDCDLSAQRVPVGRAKISI